MFAYRIYSISNRIYTGAFMWQRLISQELAYCKVNNEGVCYSGMYTYNYNNNLV